MSHLEEVMTHAAVLFHLPRLSPRKCLRGERRELHGWPQREARPALGSPASTAWRHTQLGPAAGAGGCGSEMAGVGLGPGVLLGAEGCAPKSKVCRWCDRMCGDRVLGT